MSCHLFIVVNVTIYFDLCDLSHIQTGLNIRLLRTTLSYNRFRSYCLLHCIRKKLVFNVFKTKLLEIYFDLTTFTFSTSEMITRSVRGQKNKFIDTNLFKGAHMTSI